MTEFPAGQMCPDRRRERRELKKRENADERAENQRTSGHAWGIGVEQAPERRKQNGNAEKFE